MGILFIILFALVIFKNLLFWSALWQLKEYRLDRFWDFIKSREGWSSLFNKSFVFELLALAVLFLFDWLSGMAWRLPLTIFGKQWIFGVGWTSALKFVGIVFAAELTWFFISLYRQTFFKPVRTKKVFAVFASSWLLALALFYLSWTPVNLNFAVKSSLALNLLALPLVGLTILVLYPLSYVLKQRIIKKAKAKIGSQPSLKVIGVTGSYGKTSVKEFAYQLIADRLKVFKTAKNNNSEMGVAQTALNHDFTGDQVFIAEMAAYKKGEIKKICQICPPNVAVLTGIDQQHSALFGGQQNIITAKSEIIGNSKPGAWLILNYDNDFVRQIKLPSDKKVLTYGLDFQPVDLTAQNIAWRNGQQSFDLIYQNQRVACQTALLGQHNILNILAAVGAGLASQLKLEDLAKNIGKLEPVDRTMKLIEKDGLFLIDDSYNANPSGVLAGLFALTEFKMPKVIVLDDILELGEANKAIHQQIAKKLSELEQVEKIILCGKNFAAIIKKQLINNNFPADKIILSSGGRGEGSQYLASLNQTTSKVILFEGRRSQNYLNHFIKQQA